MNEEGLMGRVRMRGGFAGRHEAGRAVRATLVALGERLRDDERAILGRALPPSLAAVLDRCAYAGDFDRDELFARVARHEAVERGFAMEHAEVVCQVLGELVPEEPLGRLRRDLGASIAALFDAPPAEEARPRIPSTSRSTLATGRPGSRTPLSEGHAVPGHARSIARSDEAHVDTKLSSARGYSQEQTQSTLATGHVGAERSIAEEDE